MSRSLQLAVEEFITKYGRAQLCVAIGKSEATLSRWVKGRIPTTRDAYRLALACGCSEQEALLLAKESPSKLAKETA